MKRYAIVTNAQSQSQAEAYLPGNYEVIAAARVPAYEGATREVDGFVIAGEDSHGWTLDGYVIPRYASGLIGCTEVDSTHPAIPAE
jgi:hypothetical protein